MFPSIGYRARDYRWGRSGPIVLSDSPVQLVGLCRSSRRINQPWGYRNPAAETRPGREFRTIVKLNLIGHPTPIGITFAFAVFSCALPSVYRVLFLKPQPVVIARDLARR
jgi:hypothetical protein